MIVGPKKLQHFAEHIFFTHINLWTTLKFGFHPQEIKKKHNNISAGCLIFNMGPNAKFG